MDASHVHDGKKITSLLELPDEMILHVCSFFDTSTLLDLSLVCKWFNEILKKSIFIWKARINRISPYANYPLLQPANPDELFWKRSCVAIEKQTELWKEWDFIEKLRISNSMYTTIDALLLMDARTVCVATYLDSTTSSHLLYYKLSSPEKLLCETDENEIKDCIKFAHKINGRICDLTAIDNTIYSCGLDQHVKSWMLINTGLVRQRTYEMNDSGVLCISSCPERSLFATGSYTKTIFVFDSRQDKPIKQYQPHTGAVIKLAMNSEYILSASRDKTVSVWDQRAGRIMKSITISGYGVPTCMNMQRDWVCVGDSTAKLHLLDLKNDFELMKSYSTKHTTRITGIHITDGCLITAGSTDCIVRFSSLTDPPQTIAKMFSGFTYISRMAYLNDTLVISGMDDGVGPEVKSHIMVWRPTLIYSTKHQKSDLHVF